MPRKKSEILYIGIDLGTSRSAVVSSSDKRHWVESYVGWPRDFVARKMLGKPILFGAEALENRLSVNLVRPLQHGVIRDGTLRDEQAVRELIHHLIKAVEPGDADEIYAAVGVPAEALKVNKLAIRDAVKEYADALMVVSEPFAVAYGEGALNNAMIIDIGAGTVDFCIMHGTMPGEEDQRTLLMAGDFIDEQLEQRLGDKYPDASFSETLVRGFKEQQGYVGETSQLVKVDVPVGGASTKLDITEPLKQACESILPPIAEAVMDLIARYEPDFQEVVKKNVYLAGGGSMVKGMTKELETLLKPYGSFKIKAIKDPLYAGAEGALALAQDMPEEYWENM